MERNINISRLLTHSIGWLTVIGISFFIPSPRHITQNELYAILNAGLLISAFYLNYFVLVPKVYLDYSIVWYLVVALLVLFVIWLAYGQIYDLLSDNSMHSNDWRPRRGSDGRVHPKWRVKYFRSIPLIGLTLIGMFISLLIALQENNRRKELEIASVKASLLDQELNILRSQINPHFLFNALNNIYSISINRPKDVGPVILKLSEMLRYAIYDIGENTVSINKEIKYIANYIELLELKDPSDGQVTFNYTASDLKINPMILIVFVENSFKHGNIGSYKGGYVSINLDVDKMDFYFEITNSLPPNRLTHKEKNGIGISNARKRLELAYPQNHTLDIQQTEEVFSVKLKIKLSQ